MTGIIIVTIFLMLALLSALLFEYFEKKSVNKNIGTVCGKSMEVKKYNFADKFERTGLPIIALKINGAYQYFLADSGASINMLKQSFYDSIENKPKLIENKDSIYTGSDAIKSEYCNFDVEYDGIMFNDERFNIAQLNVFDANRDAYGMDIVGIIGSAMMEKYKWSIDYDKMLIAIPHVNIQNI